MVNWYHILYGEEQGGNGGPLLFWEGRDGGEGTGTFSEEGKKGVPSKKYGGYTSLTTTARCAIFCTALNNMDRESQKNPENAWIA